MTLVSAEIAFRLAGYLQHVKFETFQIGEMTTSECAARTPNLILEYIPAVCETSVRDDQIQNNANL